jgi:hypothetical protein
MRRREWANQGMRRMRQAQTFDNSVLPELERNLLTHPGGYARTGN